jgi:phage recombination protein Bet
MTALATQQQSVVDFTDGQVDLIKRTICKPKDRDATDDELALFVGQAKRTGLDPFDRQIYAVFRWDGREKREKMQIQASIDGLRLIAERSGHYVGQVGPYWCGENAEWREIWPKSLGYPVAAKVIVRKLIGGHVAETPAVAHWDEYVVTNRDGSVSRMWGEKSALMLAKCAEALALRKAFPNDMSGIYVAEEMGRADGPQGVQPVSSRAQPAPPDEVLSDIPGDWPPTPQSVKLKDGREGMIVGLPNEKGEIAVTPNGEPTDFHVKPDDIQSIDGVKVDGSPDSSVDRIDENYACDIHAEFKRRGLRVGDFRDVLTSAGVQYPDDLGSAEKRIAFLKTLTADEGVRVGQALQRYVANAGEYSVGPIGDLAGDDAFAGGADTPESDRGPA